MVVLSGSEHVCLMVFNATFNNISVISWRSAVLVGETVGSGESHRPATKSLTHFIVYPMLPVSLDYLFLIAPSVFSNVYCFSYLSFLLLSLHVRLYRDA
jgi:hypothetical protein